MERIKGEDLQQLIDKLSENVSMGFTYDAQKNRIRWTNDGKEFYATLTKGLKKYFAGRPINIAVDTVFVGSNLQIRGDVTAFRQSLIVGGLRFNQYCGYLFETIFFERVCQGLRRGPESDQGYARQIAMVNAYENAHPGAYKSIWFMKQDMRAAVNDFVKSSPGLLDFEKMKAAYMGTEANSPEDVTLVFGDYQLTIDLKSLTANETGNVEWVGYATKLSREFGLTPFVHYIQSERPELWHKEESGKMISDEEWAKRLSEGGQKSAVYQYIVQKVATGNGLRSILQKGNKQKNLNEKILIIQGRTNNGKSGGTINATINMEQVYELLTQEAEAHDSYKVRYTQKIEEIPPNWRRTGEAYLYVYAKSERPLAAFSLTQSEIEKVGYYNRQKKKGKADVAIGFALNHNALFK